LGGLGIGTSFVKKNIYSKYMVTWIWALNAKAMDEKTTLSEVFTNNNATNVEDEDVYEEEVNDDEDTKKNMDVVVAIELYSDYT
jgi:hypothetical protein